MEGGVKKRKGRNYGHIKGVETVKKIVTASINFKIPLYHFTSFLQKIGSGQKRNIFCLNLLKIILHAKLIILFLRE